MSEKIAQKELDELMDKLFSIAPKNRDFFRKHFAIIATTNLGRNLLRSISADFNGEKISLNRKKQIIRSFSGFFSSEVSNITIITPIIPSFIGHTSEALFHELTHLRQFQKNATSHNVAIEQDAYFINLMEEADASVSTHLFKLEKNLKLNWSPSASSDPILRGYGIAKSRNPNYSEQQLKREAIKYALERMFTKTRRTSKWRKLYEGQFQAHSDKSRWLLCPHDRYPSDNIFTALTYYMEKYGLTKEECLRLQKLALSTLNEKFSRQKVQRVNDYTTDIYEGDYWRWRIIKKPNEVEIQEYPDGDQIHKQIQKNDGTYITISSYSQFETLFYFDKVGRLLKKEEHKGHRAEDQTLAQPLISHIQPTRLLSLKPDQYQRML